MHPWIEDLPVFPVEDLSIPLAQQFARHVDRFGYKDARVIEARRVNKEKELVIIEVSTGCGQRPAYAFKGKEVLGVQFEAEGQPIILSAREDFPDTPHQNWSAEGLPYSPCMDNRRWEQARLTYTPSELLHRILEWFRQASKGELHGTDLPLDPNLLPCGPSLVLPKDISELFHQEQNITIYASAALSLDDGESLVMVNFSNEELRDGGNQTQLPRFLFIPIEIQAEHMTRMRQAPKTLASLHAALQERGCDLWDVLRERVRPAWPRLKEAHVGIILKTPMINPATDERGGDSVVGFILQRNLRDLAIALGIVVPCPTELTGEVLYAPPLRDEPIDDVAVNSTLIYACPVSQHFTPALAARLAGRSDESVVPAVLVGAGAVGSLVIESLFREGRFSLTILDRDLLLPHNLARHTLPAGCIGWDKAQGLAAYLECILPMLKPVGHRIDVLRIPTGHVAHEALSAARVILDASASIPVARHLSDLKLPARRVSFFYTPAGTAAALLVEDEARTVDLRCLEATMYSMVLNNLVMGDFWQVHAEMIPYSGDCRAVTTRLAASQAQTLSGLIARGIGIALAEPDAVVALWRLEADGSVCATSAKVHPPTEAKVQDWTVRVLPLVQEEILALRMAKLPNETGGSLLGIVDVFNRRIEVLAVIPAPPDSLEHRDGFTRGVEGLFDQVMTAIGKCNNEIRYIGEWHSHPPRAGLQPSRTDINQLQYLTEALSEDGCPGVQIIAGDKDIVIYIGQFVSDD